MTEQNVFDTLADAVERLRRSAAVLQEASVMLALAAESHRGTSGRLADAAERLREAFGGGHCSDPSRDALEAARKASRIVSEAAGMPGDTAALRASYATLTAEHRTIRDWLTVAAYDEPESATAASVVRESLDRTEASFRDAIAKGRPLEPFRDALASAGDTVERILERAKRDSTA